MKKFILFIGGLSLLLTLTGCRHDQGASASPATAEPKPAVSVTEVKTWTAAPTDVPIPETPPATAQPVIEVSEKERILAHCISILDELPCSADLDGDGLTEIVDLTTLPGTDGQPRWTLLIQKGDEVKLSQTDILSDMPCDLWMGDLDEDGRYELFFHGDLASDDYILYAYRCDLSCLFFEPDERAARWGTDVVSNVYASRIEGFEDGHIIIEGVVDMLGTHWGVRTMTIGDDGVIGPVSTVWSFDEDFDRALTVKKALTAYKAKARKDPGEAFTLQSGDRIVVRCSDGCERMWFETDKGQAGVLLLTPDEQNMWLIDGEPEADFFEFLPYAG